MENLHGGSAKYICVILVIPLGWWMVWNPLVLDPYDGVFGCFDLAALLRLPHLKSLFGCFVCYVSGGVERPCQKVENVGD